MKSTPVLPELPAIELEGFTLEISHYLMKEYIDIGEAATELPALIENLNYQAQCNTESLMRKEAELGRVMAEIYFSLKNGGFQRAGYGEKTTEDALKMAIKLDPKVQELQEDVAIRTGWSDRLKNLMKTFQFKLELVRSTEATRRKLPEEPR